MKKTRVPKSWSKRNLPEELWPEILSWLPVKSLLRFRSASRSWKAMIDDPDFGRSHLNRFNKRQEARLLFVQGDQCERVVKNSTTLRTNFSLGCCLQSDTTPASDYLGLRTWYRWYVFSSIDGLFVLKPITPIRVGRDDVMLWNPSIRRTLTLPPPPGISTRLEYVDFGLGFDPSVQDFKFVTLALAKWSVISVAIYTLGLNSWKSLEFRGDCSKQLSFLADKIPVPLNGVIYTLATPEMSNSMKLISFDLRSELFASFALPASAGPDPGTLTTVDEGRTLAMVRMPKPEGSVWVLERLGDDTKSWSWIRLYSFVTQHPAFDPKFLCIKKNGEILLKSSYVVICHNLETQHEKVLLGKNKKILVDGCCGLPYMESLILHQ